MSRARYGWLCALALLSCADRDVTTLGGGALPPGSETPASQTLQRLGEPDSVEAACRLVGVAATNLGPAAPDAASRCEAVVDDCRDTLAGFEAPADVEVPDGNLEALLGCELSLAELDACVAGVIGNARDAYAGSLDCGAATAPAPDALGLLASPACFIVALRCPQILMSLGALGPR